MRPEPKNKSQPKAWPEKKVIGDRKRTESTGNVNITTNLLVSAMYWTSDEEGKEPNIQMAKQKKKQSTAQQNYKHELCAMMRQLHTAHYIWLFG